MYVRPMNFKGPVYLIEIFLSFNKEMSTVGTDGIRVCPLLVRQLDDTDDGLKVRCYINYQEDKDHSFGGGVLMSGEMTLRLASITSFTSSKMDPIAGDVITLTCVATGENVPTFSFTTNGGDNFDTSLYELVRDTVVSSAGTQHTATYITKTIKPNVVRNGEKIVCQVSYSIYCKNH